MIGTNHRLPTMKVVRGTGGLWAGYARHNVPYATAAEATAGAEGP